MVLTRDHTPLLPDEMARVIAAGGYVTRGRVNGTLGISRSFGDIMCKDGKGLWEGQQVISQPEQSTFEIEKEDEFLILACDGLWDVMTNQQAVYYVQRRLLAHRDVQRAARELADKAVISSSDNCSCIVVCLNQLLPAPSSPILRQKG
ncbi:unnamed protein product, partial [Discosporangium mesarthrocarpum]